MPAHMLPKPKLGSATAMQRARRRLVEVREKAAKDDSKERDGWRCTYPGCTVCGPDRVEAMHRVGAGMGCGRPCYDVDGYDTGCREHHRGRRSIHSTHLRITVAENAVGDLIRYWWRRESLDDDFEVVGASMLRAKEGRIS